MKIINLFILTCCFVSCTVRQNYVPVSIQKMPTSYIFHVQIDTLRRIIINEFCKRNYNEKNTYTRKYFSGNNLVSRMLLEKESYKEDDTNCYNYYNQIYFYGVDVYDSVIVNYLIRNVIGLSYNYRFVVGKNRNYSPFYDVRFVVSLESIDTNTTKAKVIAVCPKIAIGYRYTYNFHNDETKEVIWEDAEPSTIEEYQILLRIGKALGVQDSMPKLEVPVVH